MWKLKLPSLLLIRLRDRVEKPILVKSLLMVPLAVCMTLVIGEPVTKVHMADWRIMLIMMNTEMLQVKRSGGVCMKMNTFKRKLLYVQALN